jgi:L-ribulose-5-phosphate 3-epimerase
MKRSDFIKLGTAGLASAAITGVPTRSVSGIHSSDQATTNEELKKGFMLQTFPSRDDYSLLEQFETLKKTGFHGVEPESGLHRAEVLEAKKQTGLEIPSVVVSTHWSQPLSSPNRITRAAGVEGVKIALQDAYEYGASTILLVPGVVNEEVSYDDAYRRSQHEIQQLIPIAEDLGVTIAIENVWNQFLLSPLEAVRYIDEFNSSRVKWYFDIGNIINFGYPEQWIRILGDRIAMIHIKEYSREKRNEEGLWRGFQVNFMEGDNNWPEIMKALRETGYTGYGIAEPPFQPEGVGDESWLEQYISGRMDEIFSHYSSD